MAVHVAHSSKGLGEEMVPTTPGGLYPSGWDCGGLGVALWFPGRRRLAAFILVLPSRLSPTLTSRRPVCTHPRSFPSVEDAHPLLTSGCASSCIGTRRVLTPPLLSDIALFLGACSSDVRGDPHLCTGAHSPSSQLHRQRLDSKPAPHGMSRLGACAAGSPAPRTVGLLSLESAGQAGRLGTQVGCLLQP